MRYTAASFFSGIGGLDLAFAWSGFNVVYQCEIDDYCRQVLKKWKPIYWPNARMGKDIKNVTGSDVGAVDVVFGGFPCQDISIAGKQAGIQAGTRSGLWFEFLRIIGDIRPRAVLLENVSAILATGGDIVIGSLARIGYDAQWQIVRASDAGAPHQRARWFCVAYRTRQRRNGSRYHRKGRLVRKTVPKSGDRAGATHTPASSSLAYATGTGSQKRQQPRRWSRAAQIDTGLVNRPKRQRKNVGHTRLQFVQRQRASRQQITTTRRGTSEPDRSGRHRAARQPATQSRLGRGVDGVSRRIYRHRRICRTDHHAQRWPASPAQAQCAYEPPRVIGRREHRTDRIKALGNAVVPQQALPVVQAVKALLNLEVK